MNQPHTSFKLTFILLISMVWLSPRVSAETSVSDTALQAVSAEITRAIKAGEIEGGLVLVIADGKQILFDTQGHHDLDDKLPFKPDTLLRIYSMTKPITSVAAMTLWEQGKFKLDDPVSQYIAAFKTTEVGVVEQDKLVRVATHRPLTVRDLLRHTSGYDYGGPAGTPFGDEYRERGIFYSHYGMYPPKMTIREAADALAQVPLRHQPGQRWTYGLSIDILAALIEIWSGKPFDRYMHQSVLKPLGMQDTFFNIPKNKRERFSSCHTALVSTTLDYGRFSQMLTQWGEFDDVRILKKETLQEMFKNQIGPKGGRSFGLGFSVKKVTLGQGKTAKEYGEYGWGGYASTQFTVIPDANLCMVFMRQTVNPNHRIVNKLFTIIREGTTVQ
jgi:CubicO group peptidase (beta-lactamase class C family)